ncbi:MAG: polysaccharide deacetylase family protein, partial [Xanthomonadales bacterium]|nr:polysaccharide deacetylase family protein [Xanthomonadales bacterium]
LYHSVGHTPWAIARARFAEQIRWLSQATRLQRFDEVLTAPLGNRPTVAITFDDGYASLRTEALPVLREHGAAATVYLNTGWIGEGAREPSNADEGHYPGEAFLSWSDVEALQAAGWLAGSHGEGHFDLTARNKSDIAHELAASKRAIESRLGVPCVHFAYTWGRYNEALKAAVRATGYRTAATGIHGTVKIGVDPYAIPRIDVHRDYTLDDFKAIVRGDWDYLGWLQRARRALK